MNANIRPMEDMAERIAKRLVSDTRYFASFAQISTDKSLTTHHIEIELSCDRPTALRLCLCTLPRLDQPTFQNDVEQLAKFTGLQAGKLAALVRMRQSLSVFKTSSKTGFLAAARDEASPYNSDKKD